MIRMSSMWIRSQRIVGSVFLSALLVGVVIARTAASPRLFTNEPKPDDATHAILAAFNTYDVVGLNAGHGQKDLDDFILSLIRHPAFPSAVNDIVVECGNSLYQSTLDRYVAGEDVPLMEVQKVWRNTTQNMCVVSSFYAELFPLVREINRRLPAAKRLRMLAGDPPIDWKAVNGPSDAISVLKLYQRRDTDVASVMEQEVFAKHRKALMLYGIRHLFHGQEDNAVGLLEKKHPGATFTIYDHGSFGCVVPSARENDELEARMTSWPVPSVANIKDTWLADVPSAFPPLAHLSGMADAYLYLGPRNLALFEPRPAFIFVDKELMAELDRRARIGVGSSRSIADPENVRARDANPLLCGPDVPAR